MWSILVQDALYVRLWIVWAVGTRDQMCIQKLEQVHIQQRMAIAKHTNARLSYNKWTHQTNLLMTSKSGPHASREVFRRTRRRRETSEQTFLRMVNQLTKAAMTAYSTRLCTLLDFGCAGPPIHQPARSSPN